jgi:hypothetical protein
MQQYSMLDLKHLRHWAMLNLVLPKLFGNFLCAERNGELGPGRPQTWQGGNRGQSKGDEWGEGPARKGVWDRLKSPPQLVGDFDAGEEFEAPLKRRIPENDAA